MYNPTDIYALTAYDYPLTDGQIAQNPNPNRDMSKLLVYDLAKDTITHTHFKDIGRFLPNQVTLTRNTARVIEARLFFQNPQGTIFECFCLEPFQPKDMALAMGATQETTWICLVRKLKKLKQNQVLSALQTNSSLRAELISRDDKYAHIRFTWEGNIPFAQILEENGKMPIPPYLNREAVEEDALQYQTVYSKERVAVAAPTAGLHFTQSLIEELTKNGVSFADVVLHVGAGTFVPVQTDDIRSHQIHTEKFTLTQNELSKIINSYPNLIALGTTSLRVLESLFFIGLNLIKKEENPFFVPQAQSISQQNQFDINYLDALKAIEEYLSSSKQDKIEAETQIFIFPGYKVKSVKGLITNFHQPKSTLLMLIASLIGEQWKKIYKEALDNNYHFLSYGDSSLLLF